jgi:hypothetical protein
MDNTIKGEFGNMAITLGAANGTDVHDSSRHSLDKPD